MKRKPVAIPLHITILIDSNSFSVHVLHLVDIRINVQTNTHLNSYVVCVNE